MNDYGLGFYYLVYFPEPHKDRLKAYLDGEEDYRYFKVEEFLELLKLIPFEQQTSVKATLKHMTGFIWDVSKGNVAKLNTKYQHLPYKEAKELQDQKEAAETEDASPAENFWYNEIEESRGRVKVRIPK